MVVWRIAYCPTPVPPPSALLAQMGFGSTLASGRWHLKGALTVVYSGSSRALCQLEKRVHANGARPKDQALMRLELPPQTAVQTAEELGLPAHWATDVSITQALGLRWLGAVSGLALSVPSFIEPQERNILLNPAHPQFGSLRVVIERQPFVFDERLFAG